MERIISILVITLADKLTQGRPVNRGFSIKFNPVITNEDVKFKTHSTLFTKIPHEVAMEASKREFLTKVYFQHSTDLPRNGTKPMAKILFPAKRVVDVNTTETFENFINIPIVPQPFPDYKIIVATAPWNVRISGDEAKPAVIYIVFPEDDSDSKSMNIPAIYFIKKPDGILNVDALLDKKDKIDPVIIVDNNRTVTGLKSNEVPKYVKFKNSKLKSLEVQGLNRINNTTCDTSKAEENI